jgi:hypothetical protein
MTTAPVDRADICDARLAIEDRTCDCGTNIVRVHVIGARRVLVCEDCDAPRGVLGDRSVDLIHAICRGRGKQPIVLRRSTTKGAS